MAQLWQATELDLQTRKPELIEFSTPQTIRALASDWLIIAGAISSYYVYPSFFTFLAAQLLVASRQHALFVMMHETAHGFLTRSRNWNDRIGNWFASWPIFISMERFRARHWVHHRFTGTAQDPDWTRKADLPDWQFPKTKKQFWRIFSHYLWGRGVLEMGVAIKYLGVNAETLRSAWPYYLGIAAALTLTHSWGGFALFWLLPYVTVLPVLHRVRMIMEHYALPNENVLDNTRNVISNRLSTFFFGPHGGSLHLVHHLCPYIPWFNVKKARDALLESGTYRSRAHENDGYFLSKNSAYGDLVRERNTEMKKAA